MAVGSAVDLSFPFSLPSELLDLKQLMEEFIKRFVWSNFLPIFVPEYSIPISSFFVVVISYYPALYSSGSVMYVLSPRRPACAILLIKIIFPSFAFNFHHIAMQINRQKLFKDGNH